MVASTIDDPAADHDPLQNMRGRGGAKRARKADSHDCTSTETAKEADKQCWLCTRKTKDSWRVEKETKLEAIYDAVTTVQCLRADRPDCEDLAWLRKTKGKLEQKTTAFSQDFDAGILAAADVYVHTPCFQRFVNTARRCSFADKLWVALEVRSQPLMQFTAHVKKLLETATMVHTATVFPKWQHILHTAGVPQWGVDASKQSRCTLAQFRLAIEQNWLHIDANVELCHAKGKGKYCGYYIWTTESRQGSIQLLASLLDKHKPGYTQHTIAGDADMGEADIEFREFLKGIGDEDSYDNDSDDEAMASDEGAAPAAAGNDLHGSDTLVVAGAMAVLRQVVFSAKARDPRDVYLPSKCTVPNMIVEVGGSLLPAALYQLITGEWLDPSLFERPTTSGSKRNGKLAQVVPAMEPPENCDRRAWFVALNQAQNLLAAATGRITAKHASLGVSSLHCYIYICRNTSMWYAKPVPVNLLYIKKGKIIKDASLTCMYYFHLTSCHVMIIKIAARAMGGVKCQRRFAKAGDCLHPDRTRACLWGIAHWKHNGALYELKRLYDLNAQKFGGERTALMTAIDNLNWVGKGNTSGEAAQNIGTIEHAIVVSGASTLMPPATELPLPPRKDDEHVASVMYGPVQLRKAPEPNEADGLSSLDLVIHEKNPMLATDAQRKAFVDKLEPNVQQFRDRALAENLAFVAANNLKREEGEPPTSMTSFHRLLRSKDPPPPTSIVMPFPPIPEDVTSMEAISKMFQRVIQTQDAIGKKSSVLVVDGGE